MPDIPNDVSKTSDVSPVKVAVVVMALLLAGAGGYTIRDSYGEQCRGVPESGSPKSAPAVKPTLASSVPLASSAPRAGTAPLGAGATKGPSPAVTAAAAQASPPPAAAATDAPLPKRKPHTFPAACEARTEKWAPRLLINASDAARGILRDPALCQSRPATRFLLEDWSNDAECCSIGSACTGDWSARKNCAWSDCHQIPSPVRIPDPTTMNIDRKLAPPRMLQLPPGACLLHKSVNTTSFSRKWLAKLINEDGRVPALLGASHQRTVMRLLDPMLQKIREGTKFDSRKTWVAATNEQLSHYGESRYGDVDIEALVRSGATDILFGRGMWDQIFFDTPLSDVRVQTQVLFAELRRRLPGARITVYATHFGHWDKDGCLSLERQLLYRDAVIAAVHNVNAHVLPSDAFRATCTALNASDPDALAAFRDPIRVLEVFDMTATPEARRCSDLLVPSGNHYCTAVLLNIVARWLRNDNFAVPPPAPHAEGDVVNVWKRSGARAKPTAATKYYDAVLQQPGFHRYGLNATRYDARVAVCNQCRRFTEYYMKQRTDRNIKFEVQEECPRMHRRMRASCLDPVDYVLFNPDKDERAYLDGDSLACTRDALVARGLLNASIEVGSATLVPAAADPPAADAPAAAAPPAP
jgi:hypothetical protein